MADRDFDAVFYIKKAPTIRCEGGMFFICYSVGNARFEFVMQKSIWEQTRREARRADEQFVAGSGSVTEITSGGGH